ncbi:carbohydrate-binding family 9-like protein [Clostridium sp.]|uniref:carbohydrate-binding family 9-like protein n=1 Tax=Clostridium sp. TaxID=1506 RepID=UPI003F4C3635
MLKQYYCRKTQANIEIDGNLNKEPWKKAEVDFLVETQNASEANLKSEFKSLWNENFIYISFKCQDNYIKATMTEYNDKLYEEDVVEVFIDDNKDLKTYLEIEVNPLNAVLHYAINNNLKGRKFAFAKVDKTVETATIYYEDIQEWHTEIAIPMEEFTTAANNPPLPGDCWGINFYRIDRKENKEDEEDEYSAWSATGKIDFHMPEKFGELTFIA